MSSEITYLLNIIKNDSGILPGYIHYGKQVTPDVPILTSAAFLKWYGLHSEGQPVPDEISVLARSVLTEVPLEARGMGFVVLHRCGESFYFLIVCTWRNCNELWTTVFYKDGDAMETFNIFPREDFHKPAFCVWELVPVWHEQQSWKRFLNSSRDEAAGQTWISDIYSGPA